jgi:hypothetical protein
MTPPRSHNPFEEEHPMSASDTKTTDTKTPEADGALNAADIAAATNPTPNEDRGEVIEVAYPHRVPDFDARPHRVREFEEVIRAAMLGHAERAGEDPPSPAEIEREVARRRQEVADRRLDIQGALDEVAPEPRPRPACKVDRDIEVAAIMRLPVMVWAMFRLLLHTSGPAPSRLPMWRRLAVAAGMRMALAGVVPCASRTLEKFCKADPVLAWSHHWPAEPPTYRDEDGKWELSAFHKQLKKVLGERNPVRMWEAVNRTMLREYLGEHTVDERKGGQFANVADALSYIAVDAFLIEADLPQSKPISTDHARMQRGEDRKRCGFVIYKSPSGQVKRSVHGYKWMQLSLVRARGRVLHGDLFPANVSERDATLQLLTEAFQRWPELSLQKDIYLVGDALYDQSEQFAYELVFRFGIHPCFTRAGTISREYAHADTGGVPKCECGELAVLHEADKFPTPFYRHKRDLPAAGEYIFNSQGEVADNARLRWRCAKADPKARCAGAPDTYPRENPRLYTYAPHAGNHRRAGLRIALGCYRDVIESSFSQLKEMQLAGIGQNRPRWAGDDQMEHLVWMSVCALTARDLVQVNGVYDRVFAEAREENLLTAPTLTNKTPGPESLSEPEARAWEQDLKASAQAPVGWAELDPATDTFH